MTPLTLIDSVPRWGPRLKSLPCRISPREIGEENRDQAASIWVLSLQRVADVLSYSAIMIGAVLHGCGLNNIRERVMRRSYGVASHPPFVAGAHPVKLKFTDADGTARCKDVMNWYTIKVDDEVSSY